VSAAHRRRLALYPPQGRKPGHGKAKLILVLLAPLVEQLKAHRRQQNAERLAAGAAWQDWDLVFCTPVGAPIDTRDDWADWHALLREVGLRASWAAHQTISAECS
jgi:hypothetical protein